MERIKNFLHHVFIPSEGNNFRAKALHTDSLTYYLIFALLFTVIASKQYSPLKDVLGFATDITVEKLQSLTNQERINNGLTPLTYNQDLAEAAAAKAQDMFNKNYWAHFGPSGETPWNFILNSGYKYEYAGENLAKNFLFSDGVVQAWMDSPTHRENILRDTYSDVGFAIVNGVLNGEETTLVVQMFGKPLEGSETVAQVAKAPPTVPSPSIVPSVTPQPTTAFKLPAPPVVAAAESSKPKTNIAPLAMKTDTIFLLFLFVVLLLDFYFSSKNTILRVGGKNIAHMVFIAFILIGLLLLTKGSVLQGVKI